MLSIPLFDTEFKEALGKSLAEIAAGLKFKNPEKVFPVLQIQYRKHGEEKPTPEEFRHHSPTCRALEAEAVVYLLKSDDEYYFLSLTATCGELKDEFETDGKALGKYYDGLLQTFSPDIPIVKIAYGNPKYSINFNTVNVKTLFFNPINTQDDYEMDYITGFRKEDIEGFVRDFAV